MTIITHNILYKFLPTPPHRPYLCTMYYQQALSDNGPPKLIENKKNRKLIKILKGECGQEPTYLIP